MTWFSMSEKDYICNFNKLKQENYNRLKTSVLQIGLLLMMVIAPAMAVIAQDVEKQKVEHKFTKLSIETRAEFEYLNQYQGDTTFQNYGFNGKYFNLAVGGEFGKFSYYFRQRVIANNGSVRFFDNTDFLYMQYNLNDSWGFRFGKEALAIGGFEYDAPPIDVLYYTKYWGSIYCFQLAASVRYTDKAKKNTLVLQVGNSPYVYYTGRGDEWQKGLLAYSLLWYGDYGHFHSIYSFNMFERERGKFMGQLALGNKLDFDKWDIYVDYFCKTVDTKKMFNDFTLVSRLDVKLKDVKIFAKGGYEQNKAEVYDMISFAQKDILMTPGQSYAFYGLGVEYRPASYKNIRLHAFVANAVTEQEYVSGPTHTKTESSNLNVNVGLTWDINFLKYLKPQYIKEN